MQGILDMLPMGPWMGRDWKIWRRRGSSFVRNAGPGCHKFRVGIFLSVHGGFEAELGADTFQKREIKE
jgi:hypothetical protein